MALGAGNPVAIKATGTIHTIFIFILVDCNADRLTEMEWYSCHWKHWRKVFRDLEADDTSTTTSRSSSRKDWAMERRRLLPMFCRDHLDAPEWTKQMWLDYLQSGSDNKRFQYCLDNNGYLLYMRAIQGHSGGNDVDPPLQDNDWLQKEKTSKKEDKRYSSQPWILWTSHKRINLVTWHNHERYLTEPDGKWTRTQYIGSIWEVLKTKD